MKTDNYNNTQELQESYHFFEKELEVCQSRVKQCLTELQTSGFIHHSLITTSKYNIKCRNILCIKLLKKFINFHKANDNSSHFNHTSIQSSHQKILTQPGENSNLAKKKLEKIHLYISIISRCGKKNCFCGQNCEQSWSEPESTKEQSFNLPPEITISSGKQSLSELESTEEKDFNSPPEVTVSSVSEASPYNSTDSNSGDVALTDDESADSSDVPPIDDKSDCDSDSDSTDGDSENSGVKQEPSRKLSSLISNIAKKAKGKAKGWYSHKKL